jgi:class 3 adenylate cyclase/tetratricopeptide (TPR) repeat protein
VKGDEEKKFMKCPRCHAENSQTNNFCRKCGEKFLLTCPRCRSEYLPDDIFCGKCGHEIKTATIHEFPSPREKPAPSTDSERKHITVLFSDMSGYTAMTEKLDPEEVKEIMGKIFGEISKVVSRYEGFIEKFIGDAVMALFGVPYSHEDDPVRAIKAARDIHEIVSSISPQYEKRIEKPLVMHTGICTGLVVTGEVNLEKGTHGVLGDTINIAARLSSLAKPGEIVISPDTYHQAEGYFTFEDLEPTTVKGKAEPIRPCRVLSPKETPTKMHRLSGMRAELIGRKAEMAQLQEAVANLKHGNGSIFSIVGDAGTGKSRLIEEFKATLNSQGIQWREGHCYTYSQNTPYYPLIDLLRRAWQIQEVDQQEQIRKKVETGAGSLLGERKDLIPYVGILYSLKYKDIGQVSPETWKARLHEAIQLILANLCKRSPAVICIEDLHWADPSSVELLRNILSNFRFPAIFLCIYRPTFNLFTSHQASTIKTYHEIRLQDLSPTDAQNMVESLLKTETVPNELKKFIQTKVEGNPFYLEEAINSLLETATLIPEDDKWKVMKPLTEANIPSTVQGVISARLDRLETETKRILQEASVIGRAFLYEILKRITELKENIDRSLMGLERLDLIRTRSLQPDLEYIFKHALTQEVVYNGLLKKERQNIHEKIGQVMEEVFHGRLTDFYEALAYHFKQGQSITKAVDYLMKAGEKSLERYSIEEAHRYYKDAFDILSNYPKRSKEEDSLFIDLLLKWNHVFTIRGDYKTQLEMLGNHQELAESLGDGDRLGMFYAWLGYSLDRRRRMRDAYRYLHMAIDLGEKTNNRQTIGYASAFLCFTCTDLGLLDEAITHGYRAREISRDYEKDGDLFRLAWTATGFAYWYRGECKKNSEIGQALLDYGHKWSNIRCMTMGYVQLGFSRQAAGDLSSAIDYFLKAIQVSQEPVFICNAKLLLGMSYASLGMFQDAEKMLEEVISFNEEFGYEFLETAARSFSGVVLITRGNLNEGITSIKSALQTHYENEERWRWALINYMLGKVYLQIVQGGGGKKDFSFFAKNIGFLIKTVPFAQKKAENHLMEAIQTAKEIGAKSVLGQACLDMGRLRQSKGNPAEARKYIAEAIQLFEECEADVYLKQAKDALASLGNK